MIISELHQKAMNFLREKYPNLVDFVGNHFGHGIGLEFRESILMINDKNHQEIQNNMIFMIGVNFTGL